MDLRFPLFSPAASLVVLSGFLGLAGGEEKRNDGAKKKKSSSGLVFWGTRTPNNAPRLVGSSGVYTMSIQCKGVISFNESVRNFAQTIN